MATFKTNMAATQDWNWSVYDDFINYKKMSYFSNYSTNLKYYDDSNKSVVGKLKDETEGAAIWKFVELKPKMYSFLVVDDSKAKGVNENVVQTISHNKYKNVLSNKNCLRHLMNRIQSKNHGIGTYEINEISFSCFDEKKYIQNNGYDGLALGY